ncbi:MAG: sugar nucleotide-binding protein, partial [Acidobacteria bacterium]|nr:sugar nucleotide-binding protein [Acidobacteriota bacterium]
RPAKRPAYAVLDCSRLEQIGVSSLPPWRAALDAYLRLRQTVSVATD